MSEIQLICGDALEGDVVPLESLTAEERQAWMGLDLRQARLCVHCETLLNVHVPDAYRFCSKECAAGFLARHEAKAKEVKTVMATCPVCLDTYRLSANGRRYCSDECSDAAYRARKRMYRSLG